ncbi:hypothetical protein QN366_05025 [Pseudomonas sp. CCC3.2]|uniref:hypothetical protein n=1 Tax=unclassified Pseudomonas TaxID=196821 RepID=UPI002AB397B0|nr:MULTISPECIES: hypothetical protein [unclassified Pseudomonas]MDY7559923.1 hypothetical protein [Pseudomonas sp. AB6]MEB0179437.1 hypothetical protein [Pseudomonas sp. CCC3.2]MEB0210503.1 hypothetical protein [Pseudomonas sp. AB6]
MKIEYTAKQSRFGIQPEVQQSHIENLEARIALNLLHAHGMVAATTDGFDEAGRSKGRPLTAQEVVTRAFDIAEAAVAEMGKRNWLITIEPEEEPPSRTGRNGPRLDEPTPS